MRAYVHEHGWVVDEEHVERETRSGGELWERVALTRLREAMRRHAFDKLICYSVDRLSRSQIHLGLLLSEAERDGVEIIFTTEPLENTPVGIFLQGARAFAAELEREKIRERSMRGKRARLHSGKLFNYGTDLYGYRRDKERGVRLIEETEAGVVRQMFSWVTEEGCSIREVARRLRERSIPPPGTGKFAYSDPTADRQWGTSQVLRMLHNPAYKGDSYALRYTADHHKAGRPDFRPADEWLRLPDGLTPPIVAPATWEAAQRRLSTNTGDATRTARIPALLRGHIFCPRCGRRMYPEMTRGHLYYRCGSKVALLRCDAPMLVGTEIDAWAWEQVKNVLRDPQLIDVMAAEHGKSDATSGMAKDRDAARRALAKIEQQQRRFLENFSASDNPDFPWHLVEEKINQLQRDRARWQETLERSEAAFQAARNEGRERRELAEWCARVAVNIEGLTIEEKRLALSGLGAKVYAEGRDREAWRITFDPA